MAPGSGQGLAEEGLGLRRVQEGPHLQVSPPVFGKTDVLGKAVQTEAAKAGVQAEIRAVDWNGPMQENLLANAPTLLEQAKAGEWDAGHAGPLEC